MNKTLFSLLMIFLTASFAYGQTSPETYLEQLPDTPKKTCCLTSEIKDAYRQNIEQITDIMDKDLVQRKEEIQIYVDANRDRIATALTLKPGAAEKFAGKSRKMTKEEKKARSEEMMRQYGLSPEEVKTLKEASKEQKAALGQAYSEAAARQTQTALPQMQGQIMRIQQMQMEQKVLLESIDARQTAIHKRFKDLDATAAAAKIAEIDPLERQLASMGGIVRGKEQTDRFDRLVRNLKNAKKRHCETYAPQYVGLLNDYLSAIKNSFADYRRLEEIIAQTQMGLDKPIDAQLGLFGIEALRDYAGKLSKVYKYDLTCDY